MGTQTGEVLIAVSLLVLLFGSIAVGYYVGRRISRTPGAPENAQVGAIQGAILGLLGLLLAFSFAAAAARFLERQDLIVQEANAIGTAYLRADLLNEPHRAALQDALKQYTSRRLEVSKSIHFGVTQSDLDEVDRFHEQIWTAAIVGVRDRPEAILGVLGPVNEVIDYHSLRFASGKKKLPWLVMDLLIACSALAMAIIGFSYGLTGRRGFILTLPLVLLIGTVLWITIDFDNPRAGLMQLSDAPLQTLPFLKNETATTP